MEGICPASVLPGAEYLMHWVVLLGISLQMVISPLLLQALSSSEAGAG